MWIEQHGRRMQQADRTLNRNEWKESGSCPDCGAEIYVPSVWYAKTPPPTKRTCNCGGIIGPFTQLTTGNTTNSGD